MIPIGHFEMRSLAVNLRVKRCAMLVACLAFTGSAHAVSYVWQAYNDCSPSGSGTSTDTNLVTIYTLSNNTRTVNGISQGASGALKNFATGAAVAPTVTFTHVNADANGSLGGGLFAAGTPANAVFVTGTSSKINVNQSGTGIRKNPTGATTPWFVEMTFANLDPNETYTLATTLNRDNTYALVRWTKVSIAGAEGFVNESAAGSTPSPNSIANIFFNPGGASDYVSIGPNNTSNGAIAEWTGIKPGADGQFVIRFAVPDNTTQTGGSAFDFTEGGYGPTAFMLAQEIPEPSTLALLGMGALACASRRRK